MRPVGSIEGPHGRDPRKDFTRRKGMAPGLDAKRECAGLLQREKEMEDIMRDASSAAFGNIDQEIIDGSLRKKCEAWGLAERLPDPPSAEELRKAQAAKARQAQMKKVARTGGTTLEEDLYPTKE
jgi:hypothetical protein